MGNNLGVSFSREFVAIFGELLFQTEIVLNDAVVNDDDFAGAVPMRMSIFFRGSAVSSPAGVADAVGSFERLIANGLLKVAQLTFGPANIESTSTVVADGNAGGVVSAILQPTQSINDYRNDTLLADVTDNAAHLETSTVLWLSHPESNGILQ